VAFQTFIKGNKPKKKTTQIADYSGNWISEIQGVRNTNIWKTLFLYAKDNIF
jgi:hypothetical protein